MILPPGFFFSEPVDDSWSIARVAKESPPAGWKSVFQDLTARIEHAGRMVEGLEAKGNYISFPPREDLFRALENTRIHDVKVIILGQDPYHSVDADGQPCANGMAFSVRRGHRVPPSLANIYKELKRSYPGFVIPSHGDLTHWARQGVLLLNTGLTVKPGEADSHKKIWRGVVSGLIDNIVEYNPHCIIMLWGKKAEIAASAYPDSLVRLNAGHPSPLNRTGNFSGCDHFRQANVKLQEQGHKPIDWHLPL